MDNPKKTVTKPMNTSSLNTVDRHNNNVPLEPQPESQELHPASSTQRAATLPLSAPSVEGNLDGVSIQVVSPHRGTRSEMISHLDHWMGLIGNPVRTFVAASEFNHLTNSSSMFSMHILVPSELVTYQNLLTRLQKKLSDIETALDRPQINRELPEYAVCRRAFSQTTQSFNSASAILNDHTSHSNSLADLDNALNQTGNDYGELVNAYNLLIYANYAQRYHLPQSSSDTAPGAFHVSAQEAAYQGIYPPDDARRPIILPEATPITIGQPVADYRYEAIQRASRASDNPIPYPVVQATLGIPADVEISTDQINNLSTHAEIEALMNQRNQPGLS